MFKRLLIANRGEIACRVIRTARRLGIRCIAVFSDADEGALHVEMADEGYRIGPAPARASYLDIEAILGAAERGHADAIHPGYGFLSENADFAEACTARGIVFVGPPADAIRAMGSKREAKRLMAQAGVPLVPGYHGADQSPERLRREAEAIGWPVLLKASAGGGGRGMRAVERAEDFDAALAGAKREAAAAFGDDAMLVERYVAEPRHVEVQVFADRHGNCVHLFERDCSAQRRHQKVIEEAPAPRVGGELRATMCEAALAAAHAIGYEGAGTVEFLLDRSEEFWFMEMNTRLQVEHPVTELVTGTDLVEWQLRVASGEPLPRTQDDIVFRGHAIEARLYAEDPARGFLPSTGRLDHLRLPEREALPSGTAAGADRVSPDASGVRVDTGVRTGDTVSMHYDPMLAKVIAWGPDRDAAADRLAAALAATEVVGPSANAGFLHTLVAHSRFRAADIHTRFVEERMEDFRSAEVHRPGDEDFAVAAWAAAARDDAAAAGRTGSGNLGAGGDGGDPWSPWNRRDHWRMNGSGERMVRLRVGDDRGELVELAVRGGRGGREVRCSGLRPSPPFRPGSIGAWWALRRQAVGPRHRRLSPVRHHRRAWRTPYRVPRRPPRRVRPARPRRGLRRSRDGGGTHRPHAGAHRLGPGRARPIRPRGPARPRPRGDEDGAHARRAGGRHGGGSALRDGRPRGRGDGARRPRCSARLIRMERVVRLVPQPFDLVPVPCTRVSTHSDSVLPRIDMRYATDHDPELPLQGHGETCRRLPGTAFRRVRKSSPA